MGAISAAYALSLQVTETLAAGDDPFVDANINQVLSKLVANGTLNASSSPAATLVAAMQAALSAGALTLDFTALTYRGLAVSFSGKAVRLLVMQNPGTNANQITIAQGGANPLTQFGATFSITLQPGDTHAYVFANPPTVGGSVKNFALTGTGTQALNLLAVAG